MNYQQFKEEAIRNTLKLLDKPYSEWETFNDKLNTRIIADNMVSRSEIKLNQDEFPIVEWLWQDDYTLITTQRIISILDNNYKEMFLFEFKNFGDRFEKENTSYNTKNILSKINIIEAIDLNNDTLFYKIDSFYPAYFSKMLIINMSNYIKKREWFWKNHR